MPTANLKKIFNFFIYCQNMRTYQGARLEENPAKVGPDELLSAKPRSAKLPANYFPEPDLVKAVNLALLLEKPLLVMGDPGCVEVDVITTIAAEWYKERYEDYYFEWNIRSASGLNDGIAGNGSPGTVEGCQL